MIPACFYCGVDSTRLTWFLGLIVGSGVLSLICFAAWALINGHLRDEARLSRAPLDVEDPNAPAEEYSK